MKYRAMRKEERQMEADKCHLLLQNALYGVMSTVDENGQPYGVTVNHVVMGDAIYFHCATVGHKLDNIRFNPQVCFTAVGKVEILAEKFSTAYESAVVFGRAEVVTDSQEWLRAMRALIVKFSAGYEELGEKVLQRNLERTTVVRIQIQHETGKQRIK